MEVSIDYFEVPHNNRVWRKWNLQTQTEIFCGWLLHSWVCFNQNFLHWGRLDTWIRCRACRLQKEAAKDCYLASSSAPNGEAIHAVESCDGHGFIVFFIWCLSGFVMPHFEVESRIREVAWFHTATPTWQHLYDTAFIYEDEEWNWPVGSFAGICDFSSEWDYHVRKAVKHWDIMLA